jgi:sec-independent protein translocase protein TatB
VFDIAFSEIVVIAVVALVVIGPERLPKVARTLGHMFGRLQRYVNEVKSDISREMELDELRKLQSEVQTAARELESSVSQAAQSVDAGVRSIESQLNETNVNDTHASAVLGAEPPAHAPTPTAPDPATAPSAAASPPILTGEGAPASVSEAPPRQAALPGFDRI